MGLFNMYKFKLGAAAVALMVFAGTAHAGNTLSIEGSPEWKTKDGTLADDYFKLGYSHSFDNNFVAGAAFQHTWRPDGTTAEQLEGNVGYKLKSGPVTLTPSFILGYGFGNAPNINPASSPNADPEAYYAIQLAADLKLSDSITWNAFSVRYRNAFAVTWITPKVSTGITWNVNKQNALYLNVGYAWKDKGDGNGLLGDKWNVAVGYKFNF